MHIEAYNSRTSIKGLGFPTESQLKKGFQRLKEYIGVNMGVMSRLCRGSRGTLIYRDEYSSVFWWLNLVR